MRPKGALTILLLVGMLISFMTTSCRQKEPIRIGFIAGLSGKVADLGVAGRNGVQLAVEQQNSRGGINGRPIELVVRDDEQNPDTASRVAGELIGQNIELIIGPMTSSMAMAMIPQINASGSILLSPTVTTTDLSGKDDNFLRVISSTTEYSGKAARYQYEKLGTRTVAAIYDSNNRSYTESWLNGFRSTFEALGGRVVFVKSFPSSKDTVFLPLAKELLAARPDAVLIISNAVDSASLCQQLRSQNPKTRIVMSEWASTERFIELAGPASEGVVVTQFLNRGDISTRYREFVKAYQGRFSQAPGFAGAAGYDAALVAIEAYSARTGTKSLKEIIIGKQSFQGVQQSLKIDRFGDANRKTYVTLIKNGAYVTVDNQ
jgi:branched-chain amino acid transport system substrate-binding protein